MYKIKRLKDLKNIDSETKKRIAIKLKGYAKEPFKHARKLSNHNIGGYRF